MNIRRLLVGTVAGAVSTLWLTGAAQALTVVSLDDFNGPLVNLTAGPGQTVSSSDAGFSAGILGGYRDVTLQHLDGTGTSDVQINLGGNGAFIHAQGGGGTKAQTTIVWDGLAGAGLAGLVSNAFDAIEIVLTESDAGVQWLFTLEDADSIHTATVNTTCVASVACPGTLGPVSLYVWFNAFSDFANLDLTTLKYIKLLANNLGVATLDVTVDRISLIDTPEPTTLSILSLGLLGLGAAARRRRSA